MKLSVIIVSYNCKVYLDYCIQSVISALKNFHGEVIVIDNNSTDNTKDFIRSKGYNIKFIESKINGKMLGPVNAPLFRLKKNLE